MAAGGEERKAGAGCMEGNDLYAVLGLKKECSAADLRNAYKKLALRWHPDRCSATASSKRVEEAKTKFQSIQEAYSVLSDTNKRFLYDVGVYDSDDDANGMGEFLGEMAAMMSQSKSNDGANGGTFEELQELFVEMFQSDINIFVGGGGSDGGGGTTATAWLCAQRSADGGDRASTSTTSFAATTSSSCRSGVATGSGGHKRDTAEMCSGKAKGVAVSDSSAGLGPTGFFCFGANDWDIPAASAEGRGTKRRSSRRPKASARRGGLSPDGETSVV